MKPPTLYSFSAEFLNTPKSKFNSNKSPLTRSHQLPPINSVYFIPMPPILRSRKLNPLSPPPKPPPAVTVVPTTPNPTHEPHRLQSPTGSGSVVRRRSLRLSSKGDSSCGDTTGDPISSGSRMKRPRSTGKSGIEMISSGFGGDSGKGTYEGFEDVSVPDTESKGEEEKESGVAMDSRTGVAMELGIWVGEGVEEADKRKKSKIDDNGKGILIIDSDEGSDEISKIQDSIGRDNVAPNSSGSTRKRRRITGKSGVEFLWFGGEGLEDVLVLDTESEGEEEKESGGKMDSKTGVFMELRIGVGEGVEEAKTEKRKMRKIDDKGKGILIIDSDEDSGEISKIQDSIGRDSRSSVRMFSREEKGKGIMLDCDPLPKLDASVDLELKLGVIGDIGLNVEVQPDLISNQVSSAVNTAPTDGQANAVVGQDELQIANNNGQNLVEQRLRQSKAIARQNATRFARVSSVEQAENDADSDAENEVVQERAGQNVEDWPGPFSTAMKIIRDRKNKGSAAAQHFSIDTSGAPKVIWTPNIDGNHEQKTRTGPSLQDLCMKVLAKNSDAITSLKYVPELMVHKLVSMLCASKKMSGGILDLLFQGSPSEIRITDCSWITEEQFTNSFKACNTENLMVLQLDQCGRCMPDYIVPETLATKGLPVLANISLKGACRLSDIGLKTLISSAPALKSLNLSQCSLITETGIKDVADSLGSGVRELYLDDCQSLNVMLLLPALKKLTNLEVLSLVGIPSVCNKFLKQLIGSVGRSIKELAVADCVKVTDRSLRVISEKCSQLCALDLMNVTKLSDSGIGYLANVCQSIQTLKLCRNSFSDEAVAAFLEACGESLKELSLNNVSEVGPHTSISIARRCKNLVSLDVSWCRNLTDECLGVIADSCTSLRVLKVFGCTQITSKFWEGHSNQHLHVTGIKLTPILEKLKDQDLLCGPLRYSAVSPS